MLSHDLRSLEEFVLACRRDDGGITITPKGADSVLRAIGACLNQAHALEQAPIVMPIDAARIREETCRQLMDTARLMAGAANVVMLHADRPLWAGGGPRDGAA